MPSPTLITLFDSSMLKIQWVSWRMSIDVPADAAGLEDGEVEQAAMEEFAELLA